MRGGIFKQISVALGATLRIGESRHKAKKDHGKSPFIHSWGTFRTYTKRLRSLGQWLKDIGVKDLELLNENLVRAYLKHRFELHLAQENAKQSFKVELSALAALERGLTVFCNSHRNDPLRYDFSKIREEFALNAKQLPNYTTPWDLRAVPDPMALISALTNPVYQIMALLQLHTGARAKGVGAPSEGSNPFSMANFHHPETGVDLGIVDDPVTGHPVAMLWTKEKGGKVAYKFCSVELRQQIEAFLSGHQKTLEANYDFYRKAINKAMKATGQYVKGKGTHSLRCCFARGRWSQCLWYGYCDVEAKLRVSQEMSHNRPNITEVYLGCRSN